MKSQVVLDSIPRCSYDFRVRHDLALVKLAAVATAPTAIWVFIGGSVLPFYIATAICVLAGLEEIVISIVLKEPYSDVRTLWHVLKKKKTN